jgi:hypothetical protein
MPASILNRIFGSWRGLCLPPSRAPIPLERLAAACLRAGADDSRLGDLSERYVRIHEGARTQLGTTSWAMTAAHLAADLVYMAAAANVIFFVRAVDPVLRAAEKGTTALVAFDLRERTMAMVRNAAGKLVLPALLLVGSALLVNGAVDVWHSWRQTEALMARLQREKADSASMRIEQFLAEVQRHIGWTSHVQWAAAPIEQRRFDSIRLLRQVPAITEFAQLNADGKEVLRVSRLAMDSVDSGADFSADPRFTEAKEHGKYLGPVYLRKNSEPYMSIAMAQANRSGIRVAEINLKVLWDTIRTIKLGDGGYAYIVDGRGRLIAHPDIDLAVRQQDLSGLPQVKAALSASTPAEQVDAKTYDTSISGQSVLAVHAAVPTLGWRVFVEVPTAEVRAPLWSALARAASLLAIAAVAALVGLVVARRGSHARPVQA